MSLYLDSQALLCLQQMLHQHLPQTSVWAFGSRVKNSAHANSDLDLVAFLPSTQTDRLASLKEAFDDSPIPCRIDIHIWDNLPENFQRNIRACYVPIQ